MTFAILNSAYAHTDRDKESGEAALINYLNIFPVFSF